MTGTMLSSLKIVYICSVLFYSQLTNCSKLNLPRVLLPIFDSLSVNFRLEVTGGGCYRWSATRFDIIRLTVLDADPVYGCSNQAVVSSITTEYIRNTAVVLAEDIKSDNVVRTDVIVDTISSLNIVTTTRELYIEEAPEIFEVRAYDAQGNEFTTLNGVEFLWKIHDDFSKSGHVLRFMSFEDAPYETPDSITIFDRIGKQGNIVLIEGIRTGAAKVSVELPNPEYMDVQSTEVLLTVGANLIIDPGDAHIILTDTITFRLLQVKQGRLIELTLSEGDYYLHSEDTSVAIVNQNEVTGLKVGKAKLILRDMNVPVDETVKLPSAYLTVSLPFKLSLAILPGNNWALTIFQKVALVTQVFSRNNNRFHLGKNIEIDVRVPDFFNVSSKTDNGSIVFGYGKIPGIGKVIGSLNLLQMLRSDDLRNGKNILEDVATLAVFPTLSLSPSIVVFPWNDFQVQRNKIIMVPSGGDGKYVWASSNNTVALVSQSGIVLVHCIGTTNITLSMKSNPNIQVESIIRVLKPTYMEFIDNKWAGEIEKPIHLHLAVFGTLSINGKETRLPFNHCDWLKFIVETDKGFLHNETLKTKPRNNACFTIAIIGLVHETSTVRIKFDNYNTVLEAQTVVSVFEKIAAITPGATKSTVLAVGASMNVVFTCGPYKANSDIYSHVVTEPSIVSYRNISGDQKYLIYEVKCLKIGETMFSIVLTTDSFVTDSDIFKSSDKVHFICTSPTHLSLLCDMGPECPLFGLHQVWAPLQGKLLVNLILKDVNGFIFDNATSLAFIWKVSDNSLVSFDDQGKVNLEMVNTSSTWRHYKIFNIKNITGTVTLKLKIKGDHEIPPSRLVVKILEPITIEPNSVSMFNHPKNKHTLQIFHGSSYFNIQLSPKGIADFQYEEYSRTITLTPRLDGVGDLTVTDVCVPYPPSLVNIRVLKIGRIHLNIANKIEIGQKVMAVVQMFDSDDKPLALPDGIENDENLILRIGSQGIIDIISSRSSETDRISGIINYSISGVGLGDTTVQVKWQARASKIVQVQVFSAIRIQPRILTLIIGAEIQLSVFGGPSANPDFQYKIGDPHVAGVSSGLVKGLHLGHTTLTVIVKSYNFEVLSKDTVEVHVIPLNGIQIYVPITRMCEGSTMPARAVGIPSSLTSLVLGSVSPPLQFRWSVSEPGIIQLKDVFMDVGIQINDEDRLSMHLHGMKPGKVTVYLSVSSRASERAVLFEHSLKIEVINKLAWVQPERANEILLVAPNSQAQLITNKEVDFVSAYQLSSYFSQDGYPVTSLSRNRPSNMQYVVSISSSGLLTVGPTLGNAMVLARISNVHNFLQQTVGIIVEVKPVSYLMINVATRLETGGQQLRSLPRGLLLLLNITYHDSVGNTFFATPLSVHLESSRYDRVTMSRGKTNTSVALSLESTGSVVFQLYNHDFLQLGDYMKLSISNEISPKRETMSFGEVICFKVPVGVSEGVWTSDSDIIEFDKNGIAHAIKLGTASIVYSYLKPTSCIKMSTVIQVLPVINVQFELMVELTITNVYAGMKFNIPFSIRNEKNKQEALMTFISTCPEKTYESKEYPFTCEISFNNPDTLNISDLFNVTPTFDASKGLYACEIVSLTNPSNSNSVVQSNMTVKVHFDQGYSDSLNLTFYPAIYVRATSLHFSDVNAPAILEIVGVPEVLAGVTIVVSDNKILKIPPSYSTKEFLQNYPVYLAGSYWSQPEQHEDLSLTINSKLTKQKIKIAIITMFMDCIDSNVPCKALKAKTWWSFMARMFYDYKWAIGIGLFSFGFATALCYCAWTLIARDDILRNDYFLAPNENEDPDAFHQEMNYPQRQEAFQRRNHRPRLFAGRGEGVYFND